ncbi:MAG TPA: adenylate/guanylate cyclase domain-containing protein [Chloroflexia bacterium]|jgi:class 3 adenylate cyclase|nr:adenylate/guanylate cyclase domain-containing protein [Chloroflexia bacterium]
MKCSNCAYQNPVEAKFCQNCGNRLLLNCPDCSTTNDRDARFCKNCGTKLQDAVTQASAGTSALSRPGGVSQQSALLATQNAHDRLQQYIPKELLAKLEATRSRHALSGERRIATILFCDVVGSTALAEDLDPEEWTEIMNEAFGFLIAPVYRYEGTVARLMGDAILAFFGAPIAHEDDPQRAVLAGLDIVEGSRTFAEKVKKERGLDFEVRVGINTGFVAVGEVGSDLRVEYTAMGDAVNLAARVQTAAPPGSVLVSENTYHLVAPLFNWIDQGLTQVKGKSQPVRTYEVVSRKANPGRLRGLSGIESRMVGREQELSTLLHLCDAVCAGMGRAAVIIGEPGLGKSRLIAEWKSRILTRDQDPASVVPKWAEGRCLSYGESLAYHLLIDLLHSLLDVPASAEEEETRSALQQLLADLFDVPPAQPTNEQPGSHYSPSDLYPFIAHLLSLRLDGDAQERVRLLDAQALQTRYIEALQALVRALAVRRPLIFVLDDVHWADPSSVEMLNKLLPLAREVPILFCFVARPEYSAVGLKLLSVAREVMGQGLTEITINPLSDAEGNQLVSNLLDVQALPEETRAAILSKAEGNPFFVEEVIRMLIERGVIVMRDGSWVAIQGLEKVDIPDTLHGLLLARMDRLSDEVKYALRIASVIGRQFPVKVLEHVLREGAF